MKGNRLRINFDKMKYCLFTLVLAGMVLGAWAQHPNQLKKYNPGKNSMYKKGWIDFNKNGRMDIYENPEAGIEARVEDLLSQMTLEEKTCQMVTLYGYGRVLKDDLPQPDWKNQLWKDGIGAIDEHLNGFLGWGAKPSDNPNVWPASRHAWALNEVQRFFLEDTRLGIPTDFTNEGIRGVESYMATNFPTQLGIGHTWNRSLVREIGRITGEEARLLGYTNVYAPILDVGRDQRWGRYEEVYGESPWLVAQLGTEMVKGVQQDYQVAATGKHFVAYSNNKGAREGFSRVDPQMSPREVEAIHMMPWKRVIRDAGLLGVMSSYNDYDGIPIQGSHYWLTERLRKEMGFTGYIVSDSDAVEYLYQKHGVARDMKEAVLRSVMAGLNVRCTFRSPDSYVLPLRELVKEGSIPMEVIDERVRDILRVKFKVGLFDHPYQIDLERADQIVNGKTHQQVALRASRESLVLLKNENNTLPLEINRIKTIAVCGPNADESSYALTHYGPLAVEVATVLSGLKEYVQDKAEVLYTKGCDLVDPNWPESELIDFPMNNNEKEGINKAVENLQRSDVGVVVLGGGVRTCGENKSRSGLDLPGRQEELLQALMATGKPVILVLINGRPLTINWAAAHVPAILEAWYPGSQGGKAIAEVLFGDYNPGGKLTVTFPKSVGQIPFNFPAKPASQVNGGSKPGMQGNQSRVNGALFPFGFGLSYTTFKYSDLKVEPAEVTLYQPVTVSWKVTNTGKREGDEVVQLYIRDVISSVTTYEKNLRGFERIHLLPGETREVEFTIQPEDLALQNEYKEWVVEPGEFRVMAAASSEDIRLKTSFQVVAIGQKKHSRQVNEEWTAYLNDSKAQTVVKNVIDGNSETSWQGRAGDYITMTLHENAEPNEVGIIWANPKRGEIEFEIQLSSGGGQFLPFYKGKYNGSGKQLMVYKFDKNPASDIRILITKGQANIAELEVKEFKLN